MDGGVCITIVSIIITIISIVVSILCAKGVITTGFNIKWYVITKEIFNFKTAQEGLSVTYNGEEIDGYFESYIALWNNGKETLKQDNVVKMPYFIINDDIEIFSCELLLGDRFNYAEFKTEDIQIDRYSKVIYIPFTFDHIKHKKGFVLHICTNKKIEYDIRLEGEVKEGRDFPEYSISHRDNYPSSMSESEGLRFGFAIAFIILWSAVLGPIIYELILSKVGVAVSENEKN